jgi:transposase
MFVRIKTTPNSPRKSIQIVESRRVDGKIKQRIVRHVGIAMNEDELRRLEELAEHIKSKMEHEIQPALFSPETMAEMAIDARRHSKEDDTPLPVDIKKLREQQRVSIGVHDVCGELYNELGFDTLFSVRKQASRKNLHHITMARVANPSSKKASVEDLSNNFGIELNLQSVYRMMDSIDDIFINKINKLAWDNARSILNENITCTLYDCTTLYFESFTEDELKRNGYSKDLKFNQPQVMLGLLSTSEGLPLGYELFPGNQYEGHTLLTIFEKLKKQYGVKRIIFVADSAMLNKVNLEMLEAKKDENGDNIDFEYIVGARLRGLSEKMQEKVLETSQYSKSTSNLKHYEKVREFEHGKGRRLIVSHSLQLSEKNRHDREKSIAKIKAKLEKTKNPKDAMSNFGYKKYLKVEGEAKLVLNETVISEASKWDGLHGVVSNVHDMSKEEILSHYHSLWNIEACFRVSKHDLKIRPIYHWTPQKIKAHIAICFMSLVIIQHLAYRTKLRFESMSAEMIRKELSSVQISILKHIVTNTYYGVPSRISENAKKLYTVMGLDINNIPFKISP